VGNATFVNTSPVSNQLPAGEAPIPGIDVGKVVVEETAGIEYIAKPKLSLEVWADCVKPVVIVDEAPFASEIMAMTKSPGPNAVDESEMESEQKGTVHPTPWFVVKLPAGELTPLSS